MSESQEDLDFYIDELKRAVTRELDDEEDGTFDDDKDKRILQSLDEFISKIKEKCPRLLPSQIIHADIPQSIPVARWSRSPDGMDYVVVRQDGKEISRLHRTWRRRSLIQELAKRTASPLELAKLFAANYVHLFLKNEHTLSEDNFDQITTQEISNLDEVLNSLKNEELEEGLNKYRVALLRETLSNAKMLLQHFRDNCNSYHKPPYIPERLYTYYLDKWPSCDELRRRRNSLASCLLHPKLLREPTRQRKYNELIENALRERGKRQNALRERQREEGKGRSNIQGEECSLMGSPGFAESLWIPEELPVSPTGADVRQFNRQDTRDPRTGTGGRQRNGFQRTLPMIPEQPVSTMGAWLPITRYHERTKQDESLDDSFDDF